jgi:hypothetical protein
VVVAGLNSFNGGQPCVIRIDDVDSTGFSIRLQEYTYLDGPHAVETVHYMVMEKGVYQLADGTKIQAGSFTSNGKRRFATHWFKRDTFTEKPVMLTSIVTMNGEEPVTGHVRSTNLKTFYYMMQEEEALKDEHMPETVHFIAWEPSAGTINGMKYVVKRAGKIDHEFTRVNYGTSFQDVPVVIAGMQSCIRRDTATLRSKNIMETGFETRIEEETSADSEIEHDYLSGENVGFIAIGGL